MMDWQAFPSAKPSPQSYQEAAPSNVPFASDHSSHCKDSIQTETGSPRTKSLIPPQLQCGRQHGSQSRLATASCAEHLTRRLQSNHDHSPAAHSKHTSGSSESPASNNSPSSAAKRRYIGISALFQIGEEVEWSGEDAQLSKLLPEDPQKKCYIGKPKDSKQPRNGLEGALLLT
jgi:hypothetical protein